MLFSVKICGITGEEDAEKVAEAGADYIGVIINVPISPRNLTLQQALSIRSAAKIPVVALIASQDKDYMKRIVNELQPYALQLIGEESPAVISALKEEMECAIWKTLHFPVKDEEKVFFESALKVANLYMDAGTDVLVLDTFDRTGRRGGTGKMFDWGIGRRLVKEINGKVFLAGGITPQNVKEAIEKVKPYGIDLSSGVESSVGKKDAKKLHILMNRVGELREKYGS